MFSQDFAVQENAIGKGGFGEVFKATWLSLKKDVALKKVQKLPDSAVIRRENEVIFRRLTRSKRESDCDRRSRVIRMQTTRTSFSSLDISERMTTRENYGKISDCVLFTKVILFCRYLVMELCDKGSLRNYVHNEGALDEKRGEYRYGRTLKNK